MFQLHPQLEADTVFVQKLDISRVLLSRDSRYPWLILVPEIAGATELHALEDPSYRTVCDEIRFVANRMYQYLKPQKMNVASLGNMVPQLHIHIVARWASDAAWPGPIWGVGEAVPYKDQLLLEKVRELQSFLN